MILGVLLAVVGLVLCIVGMNGILPHSKRSKWPEVQGNIMEKEILEDAGSGSMDHYSVKLSYSYKVGEKEYIGKVLFATDIGSNNRKVMKGEAISRIKQIEDRPMVRYNPGDPAQSFLLYGSVVREMLILCGGAVLVLLGLVLLISEAVNLQF